MSLLILTLFVGITFLSLVESGCYNVHLRKVDYDSLCKKWWSKAREYDSTSSGRQNCIKLIEEKCPYMIKIETTFSRKYDLDYPHHDIWTTEVKTSLATDSETWMNYYLTKYKSVCFDADGSFSDCDYWWTVVKNNKAENKYRERCADRITSHCRGIISKTEDKPVCEVQRCRQGYEVREVTYKYNGETATFKRYVPLKRS